MTVAILGVALLVLLGSLSGSLTAWFARHVDPWEMFLGLLLLAALALALPPVMEAAHIGLALVGWILGGMQ